MRYFLVVVFFLLNACETGYNYEQPYNWIDKSYDELVAAWGYPNKIYNLENSEKLLQYTQYKDEVIDKYEDFCRHRINHSEPLPEKCHYFGYKERYYTKQYKCTTSFTINSVGLVRSMERDGDCGSFYITRPPKQVESKKVVIHQSEPPVKRDQEYCREYTKQVVIGGKEQQIYGKSCRKEDGTWEVVK
jgi:hypothetical protein